jgi:hypothetical protein
MRKLGLTMMLLVAGCSAGEKAGGTEVAAVYEALLLEHCCLDHAIVQEVTDSTGLTSAKRVFEEDESLRHFSPEIHEAVASLHARSRTVQRLPDSLSVTGRDRRLPADSVRAILARIRRDDLHRLPDRTTVVLISAAGFSRDGKLAVVRMTEVCGSLCGSSTLRALRKHPGGWVAAEEVWSVIF